MKKTVKIACSGVTTFLPIESLKELQGELKSLSVEDYKKMKQEILDTGFAFPIHVWEDKDGATWIVGGHQRKRGLEEMKKEGFNVPDVPVVYVEADDIKGARRRVMQDITQYGRVERQGLYEFMSAAELNFDNLSKSFRIPDLNLDDFNKEFFEDNAVPPGGEDDGGGALPKESKTKKGDIWVLGKNRLMCGDATMIDDVDKLMKNEKADMVFTDPPYNVDYTGKTKKSLKIENDEMGDEKFKQLLLTSFSNMKLHSKDGSSIYIAHADSEGINFRTAMVEAGWMMKQCLIWVKQTLVMGRQDYHWKHEPILYGWSPGASHNWLTDRKQTTVLEFDRPQRSEEHPTMKPVPLVEYLIGNSCPEKGLVLDLFGGSGTTMIAAQNIGRSANLMELDSRYCDVILNRWAKVSGADPVRDDGTKWSDLQKK